MSQPSSGHLKREITIFSLGFAIVNVVVGSGIFVLPAIVAEGLGATAILAYVVCGLLMLCMGLCYAELGSQTNKSGGIYTYIENAFGRYAGFLANNIYVLGGCIFSDAAVANALADTLSHFFPGLHTGIYRSLFIFLLFAGLAIINIRSVKNGVRFVVFTSFGKLIPLLVLVLVASQFIKAENLVWTTAPTVSNIGAAALMLYFAFLGVEAPLTNGGEIKRPNRTVPLGILLGVGVVFGLYILVQLVAQGVLGNGLAGNKAPLAAVAGTVVGNYGMIVVLVIVSISMLGNLAGEILSMPRMLFAGARDGLMPKAFGNIHPKFSTPHIAIAAYAFVGFVFAMFAGFKQLAIISTASALITYLGVTLATIKMRYSQPATQEKTFKIAGGIVVPLIATGFVVWLLSSLAKQELIGLGIFIILLSVVYFIAIGNSKKGENGKPAAVAE